MIYGGKSMKRILVIISIIMVLVGLSACTETQKTEEVYTYEGETDINIDDRNFTLEEEPENKAEEIVVNYYLYNIRADFDSMADILPNNESDRISLENEREAFKDGNYIKSYIIHELSTLTEKEYREERLENGEYNILYYYGWEEVVEENNLIEYEIINVNFTQIHNEKSIELGPQWGNGMFSRSFIVGKSSNEDNYRIYAFGMM